MDQPIALLRRRRVFGDQMLWAYVQLGEGCEVAMHSHESEQMAFVLDGKAVFRLGDPDDPEFEEREVSSGMVVHLPSNLPHGVVALEDTIILDVLAPPGEMGIDRQDR